LKLLAEITTAAVLIFEVCLAGVALADQLSLVPSISARGAYNDNLFFTSSEETSDFFTEVRPAIAFKQATENFSLNAAAEMIIESFADKTDLNTVDRKFTADALLWSHPRLKFNLSGLYLKDTTLNEELTEGGLLLSRNDRSRYSATAGFAWMAGERTDLDLGISYNDLEYDDPGVSDHHETRVYGGISRRLSNFKTSIFLQPSYVHYKFDAGKAENYQALAGIRHDFTERTSLQILAGPNHVRSERTSIRVGGVLGPYIFLKTVAERESLSGWVTSIEAKKACERGSLRAGYTEEITGSGYGLILRRRHSYLSSSFQFSERLRGNLDLSCFRIKTESEEVRTNYKTYSAGGSLSYKLNEQADITLHFRHSEIDDCIIDKEAERNMIYFEIKVYTIKEL